MISWKPLATAAAAVALVLGSAIVYGRQTDRWALASDLQAAAERLGGVPATVGDWVAEDVPMDRDSLEIAGVAGHLCRQYRHRFTGEAVTILLVCGRPGQVAAHAPDVCYAASGYTAGPVRTRELGAFGSGWQADFTRPGAGGDGLRIVWAWGRGHDWVAAGSPRLDFARSSHLYKLYVIRRPATGEAADAALPAFVDPFLAACRRELTPDG